MKRSHLSFSARLAILGSLFALAATPAFAQASLKVNYLTNNGNQTISVVADTLPSGHNFPSPIPQFQTRTNLVAQGNILGWSGSITYHSASSSKGCLFQTTITRVGSTYIYSKSAQQSPAGSGTICTYTVTSWDSFNGLLEADWEVKNY